MNKKLKDIETPTEYHLESLHFEQSFKPWSPFLRKDPGGGGGGQSGVRFFLKTSIFQVKFEELFNSFEEDCKINDQRRKKEREKKV